MQKQAKFRVLGPAAIFLVGSFFLHLPVSKTFHCKPLTECSINAGGQMPQKQKILTPQDKPTVAEAKETPALKRVYSKADSNQAIVLSPKAKKLVLERLTEISVEESGWVDRIDLIPRFSINPKKATETNELAKKMLLFLDYEESLYRGARDGKSLSEIAECKNKISEKAKQWGQSGYADAMIKRFEKIVAPE